MRWNEVPLGEVAEVFNGKTPAKIEQRQQGHPVLKIKDVSELGGFRGKFESFVEPALAKKVREKCVRVGDTLVLNAAHNADYVGSKTFRVGPEVTGALATGEWLMIRPLVGVLQEGFLHHWINTPRTRKAIREMVKGIHLYPKDVARLQCPLPDWDEQGRIAEILDRAGALRAKRRATLEELENLKQSIFLEMFGDISGLGSPMGTVADMAKAEPGSIRTGPFGSDLLHGEFVDEGVAVLGIDNVVANEFRWGQHRYISEAKYLKLKRYTVSPGDVLISIMGTCGRCAVVPSDIGVAINTKHLCCVSPDPAKCLPEFLHSYFLWHPLARRYLNRTTKGAIMSGLNMSIIKAMPIPLIPRKIQEAFRERLAATMVTQTHHRRSVHDFDELGQSLQQRAFAGML